jgi:hypothetical protein
MRKRLVLLFALAAAVLAPAAHASPSIKYGLHDDAWLQYGPGTLEERLAELQTLGVQVVRLNLHWNSIAPRRPGVATSHTDRAYDWSGPDALLKGLRAHRIEPVVGLVGAPRWANGGRTPNWAPTDSTSFGAFAYAAAKRYPFVKRWLIWNEPNQARFFRPTSSKVYVQRLLNPAFVAIHRASRGTQVGAGVTAARGASGGVSPVAWIRGMDAAGARLDAYAHNPYPLNPRRETPTIGGCSHCQTIAFADLPRLLAEVTRAFGAKRIWLTEYGYQTNPPDPFLGVSQEQQARLQAEAAYRAYITPRVDMLIHYLYRDEPTPERFQSGLVNLDNKPKLAYAAFQLPLVQTARTGSTVAFWGQVRTGPRSYRVQVSTGGAWRFVGGTRTTSPRGYLRFSLQLARGARVRVVAADLFGAPLRVL